MSSSIKRYYINLQPLTPIHIGSGEEVMPYEYIVDKNKYFRVNLYSILDNLSSEEKSEFTEVIQSGMVELRKHIKDLPWQEGVLYEGNAGSQFGTDYNEKIDSEANKLTVDEFINSRSRPFIPGSSIKGAFRTASVYDFSGRVYYQISRGSKGNIDVNKRGKKPEKKALDYKDIKEDPFQTVKFSDSGLDIGEMTVYKVYSSNLKDQDSNGIPYYQETLAGMLSSGVEQNIIMELSIDRARQTSDKRKNSISKEITAEDLLKATRKFSSDLIENELDYFRNNKAPKKAVKIYKSLYSIKENLNENESMIRFGKGIGFNSITMNLKNSYHEDKGYMIQPVSRVLAKEIFPMGWAVFSLEEKREDETLFNKPRLETAEEDTEVPVGENGVEDPDVDCSDLKSYVEDKYGEKEVKKMAKDKLHGSGKLYKKYKKEFDRICE